MSYSTDSNVWASADEEQAQFQQQQPQQQNSPTLQHDAQAEPGPPAWFSGQLNQFGQTLEAMVANMIARGQVQTQQYVQSALSSFSPQAPASAPPPPPPAQAQPVAPPAVVHTHRPTVKLHPPRKFDGKADEVELWIGECEAQFAFYANDFTSDVHKIIYAASFLKDGNPQNWYLGLKRTNAPEIYDWDLFKASLRTHFVTYDVATHAYNKLRTLRQTGSAAAYVARFNELVVDVQITDANRHTIFEEGLKYELRERILHVSRTLPFKVFCEQVIRVDNMYHELKSSAPNKGSSKHPTTNKSSPQQYFQPQASSSQTLSPGEPMQIDATKTKFFGPLTPEEKARRVALKLCMYCAGVGHGADNCPNKSAKAKTRDAQRAKDAKRSSASGKV